MLAEYLDPFAAQRVLLKGGPKDENLWVKRSRMLKKAADS